MNRKVLLFLGVVLLSKATFAIEWETYDEDKFDSFVYDEVAEPRFLNNLNFSSGTFVTFNETLLLFGGGILLWGIAGAILLYYLLTVPAGTGSDYDYGGGYGDSNQGYSRQYSGRSFNPYAIDWETFSILDWLSIAEETWSKFEPGNLDCQKRLVCEIHQNAPRFGFIAKKMVDAFSYLEYAQVLRLPEELKNIVEDYLDAADRGRTLKKDCGEVYSGCDFSVKKLLDKVSHNEV